MDTYPNGRVRVLARQLKAADVPDEARKAILAGGDKLGAKTRPGQKQRWFAGAIERIDALLDEPTRHAVMERCACCLGGRRLELSRAIARDHETLDERVAAANATPFVFGHSVEHVAVDRFVVRFSPEDLERYHCVCLRGAEGTVSSTYCYCCGGHIKHHLQHALGLKLKVEVLSSALSSGGESGCAFELTRLG